ncbi:hypothetical protein CP8484711_1578, partial [Chlamydia psittaci 84-8471/1]
LERSVRVRNIWPYKDK